MGETILRGDSDGIENECLCVVGDVVVVLEVGEGVPYDGMYAAAAHGVDGVVVFVLGVGEEVPYDGVYAAAAHGVGDVEVFVCVVVMNIQSIIVMNIQSIRTDQDVT